MCRKWEDDAELRIAELRHCYVTLNRDQFFPGYCFVFTKDHVTELFHLDPGSRHGVIDEVNAVAAALSKVYRPTKINYELLGNMVPHMHWHIVPRFEGGPLWPKPIWSESHVEVILEHDQSMREIALIRAALAAPSAGIASLL
jgi:diadenosine tetraphosphate (Ap4A) HIT family hydrolase